MSDFYCMEMLFSSLIFLLFQMCMCIESIFQLAVGSFSKAIPKEIAKKNLELLVAQTDKLRSSDVGLESCSVFRSSQSDKRRYTTKI